jgi:AcrR family transcriptional regulator
VASERRFGLEDSKSRGMLLDAAEQLMREEGYAAVTSRRVAAKAGLKPQLVHYYFRTMDDLFLALMRRGAEVNRERLARALESGDPLRAVWEMCSDSEITALTWEFMALANHRKNIRAEIARYGEEFRTRHIEVLSRVFEESGVHPKGWPLPAIVFVLEAAARILEIEKSLGISTGHAETMALARKYQGLLERARKTRKAKGAAPAAPQRKRKKRGSGRRLTLADPEAAPPE